MKVPPYKVHCPICDQDFTAESVFVVADKRIRPSICNTCAIKWDFRGAARKRDRERLVAELARELGIMMDDARAVMHMPFKPEAPQFDFS